MVAVFYRTSVFFIVRNFAVPVGIMGNAGVRPTNDGRHPMCMGGGGCLLGFII